MIDMTKLPTYEQPRPPEDPMAPPTSTAPGTTPAGTTTTTQANPYTPPSPVGPPGAPPGSPPSPWVPQGAGQADWSHAYKYPGAGANVQQTWRRDPSWGGHVVWNPYWGFQDFPTVAEMYANAGGPVTGEQMRGWNLTQQPGPDWQQYFPDRQAGGPNAGQPAGDSYTGNWQDYFPQPQGDWGQGWQGGFTMQEPGAFPYPEQWKTASDVYTRFAGGLPTDTGAWWEAQQAPFERRISDQVKQMAEQMGLGGLRYGTPMTHQIADITGRETGNLYGQLAERQLGLTEAAKDRGMAAAGGLTGLGQQYLNAPQQWASQMYNMGAGMTGLGQQGLDRGYQDWLRTTAEQNPWFAQAMGYSGMQNQLTPQMYNPSFLTQLFQALLG